MTALEDRQQLRDWGLLTRSSSYNFMMISGKPSNWFYTVSLSMLLLERHVQFLGDV